jgi:hypothetical protein
VRLEVVDGHVAGDRQAIDGEELLFPIVAVSGERRVLAGQFGGVAESQPHRLCPLERYQPAEVTPAQSGEIVDVPVVVVVDVGDVHVDAHPPLRVTRATGSFEIPVPQPGRVGGGGRRAVQSSFLGTNGVPV